MKLRPWILAGLALALAGCGHKETSADHDHAEHGDHEEEAISFKEGRGLQLSPESVRALGVRTSVVARQTLTTEESLTAQVFATQPRLLALARIPVEQAERLHDASIAGARLVRIDVSPAAATRLADAVFALDAAPQWHVGDFVRLSLQRSSASALTVPSSSILVSATGTFVYVVNGEAYLRTPVNIGARTADLAEVIAGLRAGDVVVSTAVDQLWLTELRLTKGGGHSH